MDQATNGSAATSEKPAAPERVVLDVVNYGNASEDGHLTRRHALKGGAAALVGAAVAAVSGADASGALAATKKKATKKKLTINVNGKNHVVQLSSDTMLLYVLRDEMHLRGPKFGCGLSQCGACAVLVDGKQIRSCVTPVGGLPATTGKNQIVTLDGLAETWHGKSGKAKVKKGQLHPLQQAWIDEQVPQCGYCQSGMIIQAADLLAKTPRPTVAEIKKAMNGHICRCGTYNGIIAAIQRASKEMA
ncbi:MAG TPA: (2Fe-2S)-binding protein [Solirubrobacteraceae bacterium]|jgi:aerobic-type carbon monoxide dehydrogenase small subunit (CoxS/CutS family)|nr:(2Fe-2S)-binding protein [Solirubrobacteraceae bacterium]